MNYGHGGIWHYIYTSAAWIKHCLLYSGIWSFTDTNDSEYGSFVLSFCWTWISIFFCSIAHVLEMSVEWKSRKSWIIGWNEVDFVSKSEHWI